MTSDSSSPVISIDGTAASGKGTLARALARKLGFAYLDTGALYRLIALRMLNENKAAADEAAAVAFAAALKKDFNPKDTENPAIRTDRVGQMTSKISAIPAVRAEVLEMQRDFACHPPALPNGSPARGAVLDGRDIGTVVCPDAQAKLFVTAAVEVRAQRRFKELQASGQAATYKSVLADMKERDARDASRVTAPMKPAADALILDTSTMTIEQVMQAALDHIGRIN